MSCFRFFDVTFNGYAGQPIKGWLILPRAAGPFPCVVHYLGYTGGRGFVEQHLDVAGCGFACLIMDSRGQGGVTPDPAPAQSNPANEKFLTRGILDKETFYYRRIITDAARAIEAARSLEEIDPRHICVEGTSQGGGLALAAAGVVGDVELLAPDVPFMCHYRRAVQITDASPYSEITEYCRRHREQIPQVFNTLSYFDGVFFAARSQASSLWSVGLMDTVCPPSTVFAAYNNYPGPKSMHTYEFNGHEGGEMLQRVRKLAWLKSHWG